MPSFRSAKKQASHAVKKKLALGTGKHTHQADKKIHSVGTARHYTQVLAQLTTWLQKNRLGDLTHLSQEQALAFLEMEGQRVKQKTLDQMRQAIQIHLAITLPKIRSELSDILKSRAYENHHVALIQQAQTPAHQLATQLAQAAGLRAHELLTLRRSEERTPSRHRTWSSNRFMGRKGALYTVIGKGGLIRAVLLPAHLADQLEEHRLTKPKTVTDRGIHYQTHYNITGGKKWSSSFSSASQRILGWSHGAHGLRHSYAQQRMEELQKSGFSYKAALGIVSQELGHFRPEITEVYLR